MYLKQLPLAEKSIIAKFVNIVFSLFSLSSSTMYMSYDLKTPLSNISSSFFLKEVNHMNWLELKHNIHGF